MAFETGSALDMEDLIAKISTFATANGWTEDRRDNANGIFALSKNSIFVSFRWLNSDPSVLSIHQATAALPASGTDPGSATGDSGNGYNAGSITNANLDNERSAVLGNGPFPSYYLFENDASPAYLHIVVETSTDIFKHFGFGELSKVGDGWTGGEYCYGQKNNTGTWTNSQSTWMLDGHFSSISGSDENHAATIRMTGLPGQPAGSVWGQIWGNRTSQPPDDTAGNDKATCQGGFRSGPLTGPWGLFQGSATTGYIPMYSFAVFFVDRVSNFIYQLGWQPDVRGVSMRSFSPKQEVVVGLDTWVMFPAAQRDISNGAGTSGYMGIAYKKVTT